MKVKSKRKINGVLFALAFSAAVSSISSPVYAAESETVIEAQNDDILAKDTKIKDPEVKETVITKDDGTEIKKVEYEKEFDDLNEAEKKESELKKDLTGDGYTNIDSSITKKEEKVVIGEEEVLVDEKTIIKENVYTDLTKEEAEDKKEEIEKNTKEQKIEVEIKEDVVKTGEVETIKSEKETDTKEDAEKFINEEKEKMENDGYEVTNTSITENKKTEIEYEEDGVTAKKEIKKDENGNDVLVSVYDKDGNEVTKVKADKDGNPIVNEVYDKNGNKIDLTEKDSNGNNVYTWEEVKDSKGNKIYVNENGEETTEKTTKVVISEEEVECTKDDDYERKEVTTEKCNKDDEGARVIEGSGEVVTVVTSIYSDDQTLEAIKDALGDYGLVAQKVAINEAQTNINAGDIVESGSQIGVHGGIIYDKDGNIDPQGNKMRIENMEEGVSLGLKGNVSEIILGDESLKDQLVLKDGTVNATITIDNNENMSVQETRDLVESLAEELLKADNYVFKDDFDINNEEVQNKVKEYETTNGIIFDDLTDNEKNEVLYKLGLCEKEEVKLEQYKGEGGIHTKQELDFTKVVNTSENEYDVVYATVELGTNWDGSKSIGTCDQDGKLFIYVKDNQIAVINIDTSSLGENEETTEINLNKFKVIVEDENGNTKELDGTQGDGTLESQKLIFNFAGFKGIINMAGSIFGTIIAPDATVNNKATSSGQIICENYNDKGGELHYTGTSIKNEEKIINEEYERDIEKYYKKVKVEEEKENTPLLNIIARELVDKTKEVITYDAIIEGAKEIEEIRYSINEIITDYRYETRVIEETITSYILSLSGSKVKTPDIPEPTPTPTPTPDIPEVPTPEVPEVTPDTPDVPVVPVTVETPEVIVTPSTPTSEAPTKKEETYEIPKMGDDYEDYLAYIEYLSMLGIGTLGLASVKVKKKKNKK